MDIRCNQHRNDPNLIYPDPNDPNLLQPWDLADDFECTERGPITNVTFWGSWYNDNKYEIEKIYVAFYDDIPDPDPNDPNFYSMPGGKLWSKEFEVNEFTERHYYHSTESGEWFWSPPGPAQQSNCKELWIYDIPIDPCEAFIQEGDPCFPMVYWLNIHAVIKYDANHQTQPYAFGWKTRDPLQNPCPDSTPMGMCHFNDDAVWSDDNGLTWNELKYPPGHPYEDPQLWESNSIDLAFALAMYSPQDVNEPNGVKWSQPPIEIDPNLDTPLYCGWDQQSYKEYNTNKWVQEAKLMASDGNDGDEFSRYAVAIDGNYAIVGAYWDDSMTGSAYIFKRTGSTWTQQQKLTASDAATGDYFGYSVAIDGNYAAVGAEMKDYNSYYSAGAVYIFSRSGTVWTQQAKLWAGDVHYGGQFGYSLSLSGEDLAIGSLTDDDGSDSGAVYVFKRTGTTWTQQQKLIGSDVESSDFFGCSVSMDGDYLIGGAYADDDHGFNSGCAYIFERSGGIWTENIKLTDPNGVGMGSSVSLDDDASIVASQNFVYVYRRGASTWSLEFEEPPPVGASAWQGAVSISGDLFISLADDFTYYLYRQGAISWLPLQKLTTSDGAAIGYSRSAFIDGNDAIVGSPLDDENGFNAGSAYIFKRTVSQDALKILMAADDYRCFGTMPVTGITWWGSYIGWNQDVPPQITPTEWHIGFWSNEPDSDPNDPNTYSHPHKLLKYFEVPSSRVRIEHTGEDQSPDPGRPDDTCFEYSLDLEPLEYLWQDEYNDVNEDNIFWISVMAAYPNGHSSEYPWGWKTRPWHWMDDAVSFEMNSLPQVGSILDACDVTPLEYDNVSYDLTFELKTDPDWVKWEQEFEGIRRWPYYTDENSVATENSSGIPEITRRVADDWKCMQKTPVTALAWWGSYLNFTYEPCVGGQVVIRPEQPEYFLLEIWNDLPADACIPGSFSQPNDIIWQYDANDYEEVLVGYDKNPQDQNSPPREPVFMYNVELPDPNWFNQPRVEEKFWLSITAVYPNGADPNYDWGWTNHQHVFDANALAETSPGVWTKLQDQLGDGVDMSFVLFTDPNESSGGTNYNNDNIVNFIDYAVFAEDWYWTGSPGGYYCASDLNNDGIVDMKDLKEFVDDWLMGL
ncbi:MAG: DUF7901 domain-containing protein [Planctomycetota bacterium]